MKIEYLVSRDRKMGHPSVTDAQHKALEWLAEDLALDMLVYPFDGEIRVHSNGPFSEHMDYSLKETFDHIRSIIDDNFGVDLGNNDIELLAQDIKDLEMIMDAINDLEEDF